MKKTLLKWKREGCIYSAPYGDGRFLVGPCLNPKGFSLTLSRIVWVTAGFGKNTHPYRQDGFDSVKEAKLRAQELVDSASV